MDSMKVEWSSRYACDAAAVKQHVEAKGGVYRLQHMDSDGKYRTFYVGIAEDLSDRIPDHFTDSEPNPCVKGIINQGNNGFRFIYIGNDATRQGIERYLYDKIPNLCNDQRPEADPIEVNY